ncbi:hypothetical protein Mgra_00007555 [Meloidogyne graminicola]|uniref:Uncharacterized protein n=1 Tax=Meloidogyne graminicola TaxID=189291 RepID=A0A8S9ZIN3_9BILA|nr:hypothetical protein Mgra_00007555 [Meloidogyne graminicola]
MNNNTKENLMVNGSQLNSNKEEEKQTFLSGNQQQKTSNTPTSSNPTGTNKSFSAAVDDAGLLSFVSFAWMFPWMWNSYKQKVCTDPSNVNLWKCSIFDSSNVNLKRHEHIFNEEKRYSHLLNTKPSLIRAVFRFIRFRLFLACSVFLFCLVFGFIGPTCLVRGLIAFVEKPPRLLDGSINYSTGIYFTLAILLVEILRVLTYSATWAISYRTAIRTRGAVLSLLFKSLLNSKGLNNKSSAEVINIFANEGQRIFDAVTFAPLVIIGPFVLIGGLIYLIKVVGWFSLLGVGVFFIFDIIQAIFGILLLKYRKLTIEQTEKRIGLIGEILTCIKCIKLNAWEMLFYSRVCDIRSTEKRYLRIAGYIQSLMIASGSIVPSVAMVVMVLAIVYSGSDLKASDAFSAFTVFVVMLFGIRMIPYGTRYISEAFQSLNKINSMLLIEQYDAEIYPPKASNLAIQINNCSFTWNNNEQKIEENSKLQETSKDDVLLNGNLPMIDNENKENNEGEEEDDDFTIAVYPLNEENQLKEVKQKEFLQKQFCLKIDDFTIQKGELIGICGPVGSGKTALINSITGHMFINQQYNNYLISISSPIALCTQIPSIFPTTIRENIILGHVPMNNQRYYKAISCAQLQKDLEKFPENELSKVTSCKLSGGQRSRIALARAFYSNRDIYIFDQVFSSIDNPIAEKIFIGGIKEFLSTKTRLIVTDNYKFLTQCDRVFLVDSGRIREIEKNEIPVINLFNNLNKQEDEGEEKVLKINLKKESEPIKTIFEENKILEEEDENEKEEALGLKPVSKEEYMEYIRAGGGNAFCALVFFAFLVNVGSNIFATFWLSEWMRNVHNDEWRASVDSVLKNSASKNIETLPNLTDSLANPNSGLQFYATIYACNVFFLFLSGIFKAIVFVKFTLTASTYLHNRMLKRVIFAIMPFFHSTPTGRILNRFSKDIDEIDSKLPFSAEAMLQGGITCIGFLLIIIWVFPLFLLPSIPLFILFLLFFVCFRAGIRSLKRIENVTRSPLYEHITNSLESLPTLHTYGQTEKFFEQFKNRLDENTGALFLYNSAMRWQAVWLDLLVVILTFGVSLFIVLLTDQITPSEAGMAIAFALQMSGIFQFAVRSQTELEAKLTAVERITHYSKNIEIESEDCEEIKEFPKDGSIKFENVLLKYKINELPALKNISFNIDNGKKIGIIGRTGSGKTSICNALFRLYPLESGKIFIGSEDILSVNIRQLRQSISIIMQEATLFAGTIRFNIDPENKCGGDDKIWECLNKTGISQSLYASSNFLDVLVEKNGRNLSCGEKQLICLARVLLRNTKIVILDEPTANIDTRTDILLQQRLNEFFASQTVLLITHRLENIASNVLDGLIEIEDGQIKYFHAANISSNKNNAIINQNKIITTLKKTCLENML